MKIEVLQIQSEGKNEFEIKYDDQLKYMAKLPFVSIHDPLDLEKIRNIVISDINGNQIYTTDYEYLENFKEQLIPGKFLLTGSQKFNQLIFTSNDKIIKIYYEKTGIWQDRYVININEKQYFCYSIEDGSARHFPIYEENVQIGEALKFNTVNNAKDKYYCYLKDGYEQLSDAIAALLLYLDRSVYSSSYLTNTSYNTTKKYSYNMTNKFYDRQWLKNNFGDEYEHIIQDSKEQAGSMSSTEKKVIKFALIAPWIMIAVVGIVVLIAYLLLNSF